MPKFKRMVYMVRFIALGMTMVLTIVSSVLAGWENIMPPYVSESWWLSSVHFISPDEGWAVGGSAEANNQKGVILHYLDGYWSYIDLPYSYTMPWYFNDVYFTSTQEGWAVGAISLEGCLSHYINGSWVDESSVGSGSIGVISAIYFTSPNDGWAVEKNRGVLRHYQNGSWTLVYPQGLKDGWFLEDIQLTSPN